MSRFVNFAVGWGLFGLLPGLSVADDPATASEPAPVVDKELAAELEREQKIAERFLLLLERNPREGTALDKAYGFYVEQGKLDELVGKYRQRVEADDTDGAAWMILGLFESRRGNDAQAIEAFSKASEHRPDDPIAAYSLGRANAIAGRVEKAIAAFEQAVARKPARADLPAIFAELGRLHQRAGRTDDAAKVWDRLEAAFPGDERVKAEIAAILETEGQPELALERYADLAKSAGDEYRKVTYTLKAARLKSRLGQREQAVADLEALLGRLDPDDWLYRETRRGIEQTFLQTDDLDGLAEYYETWIKSHPEDVAAMTQLADVLADLGQAEDARNWFDRATKLAPSDLRLRRTYIDSLRRAGKNKEAIAQFQALDKVSPNDPDVIRDWGTVWLEDDSLPEAERKSKAAEVWKRLPTARPDDAIVTAQVADWFRQAEMSDEALELYAKAVTQAPDDPRYLEYLGEYQHQLGQKNEAIATWKKLASGKNHTTENVVRLAEVLGGFGYKEEAIATYREAAAELSFADRLRFAGLLRDQEKYDEALEQITRAEPLAESDEERQNALAARIETDQAANRLEDRIVALKKQAAEQPDAKTWLTLSMYLHATRETAEATAAAKEAVKLDPRSIAAQATLAKLADDSGQLQEAADAYRRLAALDRRGRTEYLKQVASLEQRLGEVDDAMATAREVLASAPGSPDAYAFYADLCFRVGKNDEGLDALRRAARFAPSDPGPTLSLAAALAEQFRTDEAIELYWQAFEKSESLDDKTPIVARLAELYLRQSRFEELLERLKRTAVAGDDRAAKLLAAEAHQATGDLVRASETLQGLLAQSPRDTNLLGRLSQLAERDRDFETALKYQREIVELAPEDRQEKARLAQLYLASDDVDAGAEFWDDLLQEDLDAVETLGLIDALLAAEKYGDALRLVDRKLRDEPENWELLYRKAYGLLKQEDQQEAANEAFQVILDLDLPDETQSAKTLALKKRLASRTATASSTSAGSYNPAAFPEILRRTQSASQILSLFGLLNRNVYGGGGMATTRRSLAWTPDDYGSARIAALSWLGHSDPGISGAKSDEAMQEIRDSATFQQSLRDAAMAENSSKRARLDWYYSATMDRLRRQYSSPDARLAKHQTEHEEATRRLAQLGDADGAWAYLTTMRQDRAVSSNQPQPEPLPDHELEMMLRCFERVRHEEAGYYSRYIPILVAQELDRRGRKDEAKKLVQEALAATEDPQELSMVLSMAVFTEDLDTVDQIFDRFEAMPADKLGSFNTSSYTTRLMRTLWDDGKQDEAMNLFDRQMALSARRLEVPKGRTAQSSSRQISGRFALSFWKKGGVQDHIVVDGAEINEYVGMAEFTLLRNVYEFHKEGTYKEKERVDDFVKHLEEKAEGTTGPKAALAHLSLAAVRDWQEKKPESLAATRAAVEAVPEDHSLRLTLARKLQTTGDTEGALAVIDAVEPVDATQLRDRELLALELAASAQKIGRAKAAATRLFGLRLDANQQLRLANVMQQIGMGEQADAVLARLRTQGGSTLTTQIELLRHYKSKGDDETAVEIARDVIRRTKGSAGSNSNSSEGMYRAEAVRVLKESGELDTLIADAKRQADRSPNSVEAQRQLAEYYAAVNKQEEAAAVLKAVSDRRPNDFDLKYELAGRVAAMGRSSEAVDLYTAALKGKPDLMSNNFYEVDRVFTQAKRGEDMLKMIGEMEVNGNNYYYAMNSISNKLSDEKLKQPALDALDKLLKKNPDQQVRLLQSIHHQAIWDDPKIAGYALDMVKTDGEQLTWQSLSSSTSISSGGKVRTLFNNVARAAAGKGKQEEFHKTIASIVEKHPDWQPGQALLAISEASQGDHGEARKRIRAVLDDEKSPLPTQAAWSLAVELEPFEPLRDLAIEACERAANATDRNSNDYQFTPTALLVDLYSSSKHNTKARELLLTKGMQPGDNRYSDPRYAAYSEMRHYKSVGDKLLEMDFPIDALRLYDRYVADPQRIATAQQQGDYVLDQLKQSRAKALTAIDGSDIAVYLSAAAGSPPDDKEPAIDLMLTLGDASELGQMKVESVVATALAKASSGKGKQPSASVGINRTHKGEPSPASPPVEAVVPPIASIETSLKSILLKRPEDVSAHVMSALVAYHKGDLAAAKAASEQALAAAENGPERTTSKDGDGVAPPAVGLWIIARKAAEHEETRPIADQLAAKSIAAAADFSDRRWTMAMLRERGQQAIETGDRKSAEAAWSELLEQILPPKTEKTEGEKTDNEEEAADEKKAADSAAGKTSSIRRGSVGHPATVAAVLLLNLTAGLPGEASPPQMMLALQPATPAVPIRRVVPATSPSSASQKNSKNEESQRFISLTQASQALELAELAAKHGMTDLSIRAVRESLGEGRPLDIVAASGGTALASSGTLVYSPSTSSSANSAADVDRQIADKLLKLNAAWVEQEAKPTVVYEALVDVVLPEGRSSEAFLYRKPITVREAAAPPSAGRLLVEWAVKAERLADLDARLKALPPAKGSELDVAVLQLLVAEATDDVDRVNELLGVLQQRVYGPSSTQDAELACHGVLPALNHQKTVAKAVDVLSKLAISFSASNDEQPFRWITQLLVEKELRLDRAEAAEKRFADALNVLDRVYSRYSGDYGTRRRRDALQSFVTLLAMHGRSGSALRYLNEIDKLPPTTSSGQPQQASVPFVNSLVRGFAAGDATTYEQLKLWTLPGEGRNSIRISTALTPGDEPPAEFEILPDPARIAFDAQIDPPATSTAVALVALAKKHGKLEELIAEVDPLADQKVEGAAELSILAHIAAGTTEQAAAPLHAFVEAFFAKPPEKIDFKNEVPNVLVVAFAAATKPELRTDAARTAERIARIARGKGHGLHSSGRLLVAVCQAHEAGLEPVDVLLRSDFGPWRAGRLPRPQDRNNTRLPPVWVVRNGVAHQAAGSEAQILAFRYPLAGSFDLVVDAWDGSYAESFAGFNGLSYESFAWNKKAAAYEVGHWGSGETAFTSKPGESYSTYRIRVRPGEVRCLVNGDVLHVDTAATAAAPFFTLNSSFTRTGWFRGAKIEGDPVIPREVRLLDGDRLDGWIEYFYDETKPERPGVNVEGNIAQQRRNGESVWTVSGGVLHGRARSSFQFLQSWIYYHRPLWDGESVEYEFFHDGSLTAAHPTLGRLAFLLEPDAVRLHWLVHEGGDGDWTGLSAVNAIETPQYRRGPDRLPLKSNDWNRVRLAIDDGTLQIALNDVLVFERPLSATESRLFGLFRNAEQSLQVRNIVLHGDWPERLDAATKADLLAAVPASTDPSLVRYERAVITEQHLNGPPWQRLNTLASVPADVRYDRLIADVLPSDSTPVWRLGGTFSPANPAPGVTGYGIETMPDSPRSHVGGRIVSAAQMLVATAGELGRLDDLAAKIDAAPAASEYDERNRRAVQALVAIERGDFDAAAAEIAALHPLLETVPATANEAHRWPELIVAEVALNHGALVEPALAVLNRMVVEQIQKGADKSMDRLWQWQARRLRGEAQMLAETGLSRADLPDAPALIHWRPVEFGRSEDRGPGAPRPLWQLRSNGEIVHRGGPHQEYLHLTTPLRGDLEIRYQFQLAGWREVHVCAADLAAIPRFDRKSFYLRHYGRADDVRPLPSPIDFGEHDDWIDYRATIKDGVYTAWANDVKMFEEKLEPDYDPWIAIGAVGQTNGAVRNVSITGDATVPKEIAMSASSRLSGWRGYHPGRMVGDGVHWQKVGNEIRASKRSAGTTNEAALVYHRPMLEDGEIEYEFYYEPGKTIVHPALDRLVFLLEPDGVDLHWMTDGKLDRTGLAERNVTEESERRLGPTPLPLKPAAWNTLRLTLVGDEVTIALNGEEIYKRSLESTNQRAFGLFHYTDKTESRIRNIHWRGDWPKSLPSAEELFATADP